MQLNKFSDYTNQNKIQFLVLILYFVFLWLVLPISLAILFAYLLYPIIHFFHQRLKLPYIISAIIISILIFLSFYSFFYITIQSIISIYPEVKKQVEDLQLFNSEYLFILEKLFNESLKYIDTAIMGLASYLQNIFQYLFEIFVFFVAFFFALFESKRDRYWFFIYVPKSYRNAWKQYFEKATNLFSYFLYVEFQLFIITFFLLSIGLALLQFDKPLNKAFLISFADVLPFFGIGLFLIPIAIYFFAIGEKFLSFALLLLYIFIQITRQLTESLLWASTFQLRTVHTFFISAASILLFGVYGILLSPFLLLVAVKLKQKTISG
ncbi:AI-2E family transporter [Ureibacillus thermophilus]|uniref:AI-2E family transporter n=1 Tax=Ureibacillus thermophilus TaxID=367743 RepID=A0A4V1A399_9BACL|nr:AI-2E family transporter [Ureibacillus thermophilus]QBK26510.1 AI-2E family transporter [Ureibacillus thermophilus]